MCTNSKCTMEHVKNRCKQFEDDITHLYGCMTRVWMLRWCCHSDNPVNICVSNSDFVDHNSCYLIHVWSINLKVIWWYSIIIVGLLNICKWLRHCWLLSLTIAAIVPFQKHLSHIVKETYFVSIIAANNTLHKN